MRRAARFAACQAVAVAAGITLITAGCGSSGAASGSASPSPATHSATSAAQTPQASSALCREAAALRRSLASLTHLSMGQGALQQAEADLRDAHARISRIAADTHGKFSPQVSALKSALARLRTEVTALGRGNGSVASAATAFGGVSQAAQNLFAAIDGRCPSSPSPGS
jgi:hypothetical protein